MYGKDKRICPCCGKKLKLIPPTKELLPNRFGVSENDIPFYLISDIRYLPYTVQPESVSEFHSSVLYKDVKIGNDWTCNYHVSSSDGPRYLKLITVSRTDKMLQKDHLFINAGWAMVFFCEHCKSKIALNFNPITLLNMRIFFTPFIFIMAAATFSLQINNVLLACILAVAAVSLIIIGLLSSVFSYLYLKLFTSNFVPTSYSDAMVIQSSELSLSRRGLKRVFLHRSNVYKTAVDSEEFYVYLTEKDKGSIKLHICGIDGERERLTSLLKEKISAEGKAVIPLEFEGKSVGSAEVLEILDTPAEQPKTFYKP